MFEGRRFIPALLEDPPDGGGAEVHSMVAVQVHPDPVRPEMIAAAQIEDLFDDVPGRGSRGHMRPNGSIAQACNAQLLVSAEPSQAALGHPVLWTHGVPPSEWELLPRCVADVLQF